MTKDIGAVLEKYNGAGRDSLIPLLQEVQQIQGFISEDSAQQIASCLGLATSKVFGVATFYNQFRFHAPGKYHIQVCRGTACHVRGSGEILDAICQQLGIRPGQTSKDGLFSIEVVACIGACGQAPVISVNGEFHAKLTSEKVTRVLKDYRERAASDENSN